MTAAPSTTPLPPAAPSIAPHSAPGSPGRGPRPPTRWPAWLRRGGPPGRLGWRRALLLRRLVAAALAGTALALALSPAERAAVVPVVVAAADLPAGDRLSPDDVAVRDWPAAVAPAGALREIPAVDGRSLVAAARAGEPITDARLAGTGPTSGPGSAVVPVRLADPAVAAVLAPGSRVDVVAAGERPDQPIVLTADATVQAVLDPGAAARAGPGSGELLVLITMPRAAAGRVAAMSLTGPLAVTLR
jgi:pilus assembly protein CpaB